MQDYIAFESDKHYMFGEPARQRRAATPPLAMHVIQPQELDLKLPTGRGFLVAERENVQNWNRRNAGKGKVQCNLPDGGVGQVIREIPD